MIIEHVAIYTTNLELIKDYYVRYFNGVSNEKYINQKTGFESYILSFASGARLELMYKPQIPENINDTVEMQHKGIIHIAFGVKTMMEVDEKARELEQNGYEILRAPRKTGDGYYEFETLDPENNRLEVTILFVD